MPGYECRSVKGVSCLCITVVAVEETICYNTPVKAVRPYVHSVPSIVVNYSKSAMAAGLSDAGFGILEGVIIPVECSSSRQE